ncbi:MAG: hypothetical protein Q8M32_09415 [Brevundimonas sp.]|nr:hypothetical protein [Brevundimonas sp.]
MADGALTLKLDRYAAAKLAEKAKAMSVSPEELAAMVLDQQFFDYDDFDWHDGDPRQDHAPNYDPQEVGRLWSEVRPELEAYLERKLAERRR